MRSDPRERRRAIVWLLNFCARLLKFQAMRDASDSLIASVTVPNHVASPCLPGRSAPGALHRVPIKWNHSIDKVSLKIKEFEHRGFEKVEPLIRDKLYRPVIRAVGAGLAGAVDRECLSRSFVGISAARGHVVRETVQKSQNKDNMPHEIPEIQSVGDDLTEEKRHASAITRVAEFGQ
ncbi:MAG: hypothetical protein ACRECP_07505 [Methylocella sp.]